MNVIKRFFNNINKKIGIVNVLNFESMTSKPFQFEEPLSQFPTKAKAEVKNNE